MIELTFVIPLYNRADLILETLNSVAQLPDNYVSVIVVDDGSEDDGPAIVANFIENHQNFKLVSRSDYSEQKGASVCRNYGLQLTKTEYIHFLDSDDLMSEKAYEIISDAILNHPENDFWVFQTQWFDFKIGDRSELQTHITDRNIIDRFVDEKNVWNNFGPVWKKSSIEKIGGFTETYTSFQDWDLMMRALINDFKFDFCNLKNPIGYYRQKSTGTISSNRFSKEHIESNYTMIVSIYDLMYEKNMVNPERRKYLANFLSRTLLYCTIDKDAQQSNLFFLKLKDLSKSYILNNEEIQFMKQVFKKRTSFRYNRFSKYRAQVDKFTNEHHLSYLYNKKKIGK